MFFIYFKKSPVMERLGEIAHCALWQEKRETKIMPEISKVKIDEIVKHLFMMKVLKWCFHNVCIQGCKCPLNAMKEKAYMDIETHLFLAFLALSCRQKQYGLGRGWIQCASSLCWTMNLCLLFFNKASLVFYFSFCMLHWKIHHFHKWFGKQKCLQSLHQVKQYSIQ